MLSKAVAYIQQNELTKWIKVVYIYEDLNDPVIRALADNLRVIDRCYPKVLFIQPVLSCVGTVLLALLVDVSGTNCERA